MQPKLNLSELVNLNDLMKLLGYKDERSAKKWCSKNQVPVIELGKNKYIHRLLLERIILTRLEVSGNRAPADNRIPNTAVPKKIITYVPDNEIISKYLSKYESNGNS